MWGKNNFKKWSYIKYFYLLKNQKTPPIIAKAKRPVYRASFTLINGSFFIIKRNNIQPKKRGTPMKINSSSRT